MTDESTDEPTDVPTDILSNPLDCTDVKALLSGIIDDEIEPAVRHLVERHLVGCTPCRTLVDETETTHQLLVSDLAGMTDETALSVDFVGGVLSRTVYADDRPARGGQLRTWLGWLVAAAALAFSVTLWFNDRKPFSPSPTTTTITPVTFEVTSGLRAMSMTDDHSAKFSAHRTASPVAPPTFSNFPDFDSHVVPHLTESDLSLVRRASHLLEDVRRARTDTFEDIDHSRRVAVYDELIDDLADLRTRVPSELQDNVAEIHGLIERLVNGPITQADIISMQTQIDEGDLLEALDRLLPGGGVAF